MQEKKTLSSQLLLEDLYCKHHTYVNIWVNMSKQEMQCERERERE